MLLEEVAREIGAKGRREELVIEGVGGHRMNATGSQRLSLRVKGKFAPGYEDMKALTISQLNLASQAIQREDLLNCPHLIEIEDQLMYERVGPSLLIGQDNWHLIASREIRAGTSTQSVASMDATPVQRNLCDL